MKLETQNCPRCGSPKVAEITYGLPSAHSFELAMRGELKLGGCDISEGAPTHACLACDSQWGQLLVVEGDPP